MSDPRDLTDGELDSIQILALSEIIREVDGNHSLGAAALAEAILRHPGSRWGRPSPAPAGEVGELVADLRECAASCTLASKRYWAEPMRRAADLLKRLASPACVVLDSNPEAIAALEAASPGRIELLPEDAQVIEPAQHTILAPAPVPVALSERPWEREGWCDSEGRCWIHCPGQSWDTWVLMVPQNAIDGAHCLPFHALPLPGVEVEQ